MHDEKKLKNKKYISWDQYFMGIASFSANRSKDPDTQVGCCIVSPENRIVSTGYNGVPNGISDDDISWSRHADCENDTKYPFICHSELNAILNYRGPGLDNHRMYVTLFPCNECSKAIIQSGIREVVYIDDKYSHTKSVQASKKMLSIAGVKIRQLELTNKEIVIKI